MKPKTNHIEDAIKLILPGIISVAQPQRVVLFGSAASGSAGTESDLDFLVIVPDGQSIAAVSDRLNMELRHKPMPCDFVVATPSMLRRHEKNQASVYTQALTRGRELYAA